MEFVGLTVAVVSQDLDVIEHRLDDLLIDPLKFTLDLEKLACFVTIKFSFVVTKTLQRILFKQLNKLQYSIEI